MGRPRSFDQATVLDCAVTLFARDGYEGTSIDRIVTETGLHRGSLYTTFGSKRGLFRAALRHALGQPSALTADLVLVALLELAPHDREVRRECAHAYAAVYGSDPGRLGTRLLTRGGVAPEPAHPIDS